MKTPLKGLKKKPSPRLMTGWAELHVACICKYLYEYAVHKSPDILYYQKPPLHPLFYFMPRPNFFEKTLFLILADNAFSQLSEGRVCTVFL